MDANESRTPYQDSLLRLYKNEHNLSKDDLIHRHRSSVNIEANRDIRGVTATEERDAETLRSPMIGFKDSAKKSVEPSERSQ